MGSEPLDFWRETHQLLIFDSYTWSLSTSVKRDLAVVDWTAVDFPTRRDDWTAEVTTEWTLGGQGH